MIHSRLTHRLSPPFLGGEWLSRSFRRRGEVETEFLFLSEMNELPLVGEGAVVVQGQIIEDGAARGTDAQRLFEQLHQGLVRKAARERRAGRLEQ